MGQSTWVASIMHGARQDHGEHLQVCELRHEAVLRKQAREPLHHVRSMRAVVVGIARLVGSLNLLQTLTRLQGRPVSKKLGQDK